MSGGPVCQCPEPVVGRCFVIDRYCNYSRFSGSRKTFSDYSSVGCSKCGWIWRTKGSYVSKLPDADRDHYIRTGQIKPKEN